LPLFFEVSGSGLGYEQEAEERAKQAGGETRGREKPEENIGLRSFSTFHFVATQGRPPSPLRAA
jgi:hypothetical protein